MEKIEVFIRLKLPEDSDGSQYWERELTVYMHSHGQLQQISMFMDEEQDVMNLSFQFEGLVKFNTVISAILKSDAIIIQQCIKLPFTFCNLHSTLSQSEQETLCLTLQSISEVHEVSIEEGTKFKIVYNTLKPDSLLNLLLKRLQIKMQQNSP